MHTNLVSNYTHAGSGAASLVSSAVWVSKSDFN